MVCRKRLAYNGIFHYNVLYKHRIYAVLGNKSRKTEIYRRKEEK